MSRHVFLLVAVLMCVAHAAVGAVWYVDKDNASTANGTSWPTAFTSIQLGVDAAANAGGGEVWVAEGTYTSSANQVLNLLSNVTVFGGFAGGETAREQRNWAAHTCVIDGENTRVCVNNGNTTNTVIDGFTIQRGAAVNGAGMHNSQVSSCTVSNCIFTGNHASSGGGGMGNWSGASPSVINVLFYANTAGSMGGAMHNDGSSPVLTNCTCASNSDGIRMVSGAQPIVTNCILWDTQSPIDNGANVSYSDVRADMLGTGNINADPAFVDPANVNFRLQRNSPCIDAGTPSGAPGTDIVGTVRPAGSGVDMGAYEYGPPTSCFTANPEAGVPPMTVQFTDTSTSGTAPNGTNLRRFGVPVAMLDFFELMPVFGEKLVVFRSSFSCSWFASVGS